MQVDVQNKIHGSIYRDGGSLGVGFRDAAGVVHNLMFIVDLNASEKLSTGRLYRRAMLETFIESEYLSPVTGISYPKTDVSEAPVSWETAADLLHQMEDLKSSSDAETVRILDWMRQIVSHADHICIF
jgi:hypothetical protein